MEGEKLNYGGLTNTNGEYAVVWWGPEIGSWEARARSLGSQVPNPYFGEVGEGITTNTSKLGTFPKQAKSCSPSLLYQLPGM